MNARRVAAIDCGTNSIRLLILEQVDGAEPRELERRMEIVRLGYGVDRSGRLDPDAIARTLRVTREYASIIRALEVDDIRFAATSATRDAENREDFIAGVREILDVSPDVISGSREAALSFDGAVGTLEDPGPAPRMVVDIGGGSTELVVGTHVPQAAVSLDMGSVRLSERFLLSDPPTKAQVRDACIEIEKQLDHASESIDFSAVRSIVGVAGTITTLSAVALDLERYTPNLTHGARIDVPRMRELCAQIAHESRAQLALRPAIHDGRRDVIGAGALIFDAILERAGRSQALESLVISERDIFGCACSKHSS